MKAKEPKVKKEKVEKKPTEKKSLFAKKEIPEWKKELKEKQKQDPLTTKDYVCWGLFILCLIIGMVPYALRAIDPTYDDSLTFSEKLKGNSSSGEKNKKDTTSQLLCNKDMEEENFKYTVSIDNSYKNGNVVSGQIVYKITSVKEPYTFDNVRIPEYESFSSLNLDGLETEHVPGSDTYTVVIDYAKNASLSKTEELQAHFKVYSAQYNDYESSGYICTTNKKEG